MSFTLWAGLALVSYTNCHPHYKLDRHWWLAQTFDNTFHSRVDMQRYFLCPAPYRNAVETSNEYQTKGIYGRSPKLGNLVSEHPNLDTHALGAFFYHTLQGTDSCDIQNSAAAAAAITKTVYIESYSSNTDNLWNATELTLWTTYAVTSRDSILCDMPSIS